MEFPDPRWNQRRIAQIRYLGELYNYKMIDSSIIFSTLYSLLMFGVAVDPLTQFSFGFQIFCPSALFVQSIRAF